MQVAASSPVQSPLKPKADPVRGDGTIKPFSFYSTKALQPSQNRIIDLTSEEPQYIGTSSDSDSDHDIIPDFEKTLASKARVPSMRELKLRKGIEENLNSVDKVEESPINFSKFMFKPQNAFPGRLDSIKSTGPVVGSLAPTYPRTQQTRPQRAQPLVDLHLNDIRDPDMRRKVERIKSIVPGKSNKTILNALQNKKGNFDDAVELLTDGDEGVTAADTNQTSKRVARAPRKAIKEKWSSTQAQRLPSLSPEVQARRKRRLVRGPRSIRDDSPISIDDDDPKHSPDHTDEFYEQDLEKKVLTFINTCDVKDLVDIAATTEVIAQAILNDRPFVNLDDVREVSATSTTAKNGKRGGRRRAVGDKVVDACIETFRGYEAVDTLIKRCEDLGKPLAEAIKSWGVDIAGAASKGELEMVDIDFASRADSGIGTPADDDDDIGTHGRHKAGRYMSQQPKNLAPDVTLKDYQLVGINWLNMLYERNLSCILADEMGMCNYHRLYYYC